ncbi:primosomal protein N' [Sporolactobacillus sp. KGMB 08714]|uniref:primosomal protein N' n=1 Tax=Sporolactobacillus sp. KGMB 08714 TaxID=3064704 RepID=UPI002FBEDA19
MIAEVYVDIAASPVDKPFDYQIPEALSDFVRPGMRVIVPFGRTRRLGFVVSLKEESSFGKLKTIERLVDHLPVLTGELLDLGRWLADTTLCPTVSAFLAMLPAVMKADYHKGLTVENPDRLRQRFPQLSRIFLSEKTIEWDTVEKKYPELLKEVNEALDENIISLNRLVGNQARARKVLAFSAAVPREELLRAEGELDGRSKRQKEALSFFIDRPLRLPVNELIHKYHLSREALGRLEKKGLLKREMVEQFRNPYRRPGPPTRPLPLTAEQNQALAPILGSIEKDEPRVFLCHGVTGSGKTEIYLQAIQKVIALGKQAIVLVPEISLTPQMVERFKGRFGDEVAVMHSGLSRGEKYDEWRKIRKGLVKVAVGARSAVFAPFERLGLIVIDEEHETSYKQDDSPRYHARDVAIYRGRRHGCPVVLGSATPSLESFARAQKKVYTLLTLKDRFNHHPMPPVEIVDLREEMRAGNHSMFSRALFFKIKDRLEKREQILLFLNRRGYSTFVMCRSCGTVIKCPHCDISLTYHHAGRLLKCHYCGYEERMPNTCPSCGSDSMRYFGTGTQKVEAELNRLLPEARVIRMDVDTTRQKGGHEKLLRRFGAHQADILLGTQMIAKGLDFPKVTLVGVLAADSMLHLPDFRASEKTFQLLTQVSGRAGRHDLAGEVVIQSYTPDHYAIVDAAHHDYMRFYHEEMQLRRRHGYPPFYFLVLINLTHPEPARAADAAERIVSMLKNNLSQSARIYGPVVPAIARIKDRYRYQCMVKYKREPELFPILKKISLHFQNTEKDGLQLSIDLNPVVLM